MNRTLRKASVLMLALLLAAGMTACGNKASQPEAEEQKPSSASVMREETSEAVPEAENEPQEQESGSWKDSFSEESGIYTAVATSGTPVAGGGLVVEVDTQEETVKFTICDTDGNPTVEYLLLNYETQILERYQYVSAMGQGFYYYADLDGSNLSVFNTEGEDRTEGAKESNHYQPAVDATKEMLDSYTAWFETEFGVPAAQAAIED